MLASACKDNCRFTFKRPQLDRRPGRWPLMRCPIEQSCFLCAEKATYGFDYAPSLIRYGKVATPRKGLYDERQIAGVSCPQEKLSPKFRTLYEVKRTRLHSII